MFVKETKETNTYQKKSRWGKFVEYKRTKTITHWSCDHCGEMFTKIKNGKYSTTAKSFCQVCVSKWGKAKLAGAVGYEAKEKNKFKKRVGSVITGKEGYPEVYIGKDYPYRKGGYRCIREHVFVMENYLNRGLQPGEIVHHIDGDKTNNSLENLFLTNAAEHNKLHAESESIVFHLVKLGLVTFNRQTARYEIAPSLTSNTKSV